MDDFTVLYKKRLSLSDLTRYSRDWNLFISAYNASERVTAPFDAVECDAKHWLIHREYGFEDHELPDGKVFSFDEADDEAAYWSRYVEEHGDELGVGEICIDATGFVRPYLAFAIFLLKTLGVSRFHVLYSDPDAYIHAERTEFTKGPVASVRQVAGFEGAHTPNTSDDLLIIGVGYDDEAIRRVSESKANARKLQLFGFPSLQPDMYQQSVQQAARAAEAVGAGSESGFLFAPANDPFVTAQVLKERVARERPSNLYLAPLGTKAQLLGFAIYLLSEWQGAAGSLLLPEVERHSRETSVGIARTWLYTCEFD